MTISDAVWAVFAAALLYVVWAMAPATAQTEREYVDVLCAGMEIEVTLPSGARADCVTEMHAIEVDFSENHSQALGQSLLYSAETGLKPGIYLICRKDEWVCAGHFERLGKTIKHWRLPVAVWMHSGGLPE